LQADQGILTYYLLTSNVSDTVAPFPSRIEANASAGGSIAALAAARDRTTSFDSNLTDNTINYDVIPRGTIFLLNCKVSANEALTNVQERLYIFTIEPPSGNGAIHLAARSPQVRDAWIRQITRVCNSILSVPQQIPSSAPSVSASVPPTAIPDVTTTNIPESVATAIGNGPLGPSDSEWKSVDPSSDVYVNTTDSLKSRLQQDLRTNLMMCDHQNPSSDNAEWQTLYHHHDGSAAYQKKTSAQPMVMTSTVLNHPVKQVFSLLIDPNQRQEYDANVRHCERTKVLSPHTFLDYYSYNPIWPCRPREFAVAVHWQIVQKGDERAIAIVAFSCDEAAAVKPAQAGHVRATLFLNLTLLQQTGPNSCRLTRILSYSLGGSIPVAVSNFILTQQIGLSRAVGDYLARNEPEPSDRLKGQLIRQSIIRDIIQRIGTDRAASSSRQHNGGDEDMSLVVSESDANDDGRYVVPLVAQAALLFTPLLIYRTAVRLAQSLPAMWFLVSAFLALRQLVLWRLVGNHKTASPTNNEPKTGQVTCRFKVDLKGVLRFLANKKDDRMPGSSEVSIVHIVSRACAVAVRKQHLHRRHISIPYLLIDRYIPSTHEDCVSVSMVLEAGRAPVTIERVDKMTVQEVADAAERSRHVGELQKATKLGNCLVLASHNFDDGDIEADAVSVDPGVSLVAVIGSVGLERSPAGRFRSTPRPILQLSLTVGAAAGQATTFSSARRLAEEIQKLLLYPEICDEG
jgi:hypothetical protein